MKLRISDPVVISRGPTYEEAGWGPYQFPDLFMLPDGRILCAFADSSDTIDAYGAERACFISADMGATWERARERDYYAQIGIELENGERVHFIELDSIKVTEDMQFPKSRGSTRGGKNQFYLTSEMPDGICEKHWQIFRVSKEYPEGRMEPAILNWPYHVTKVGSGVVVPPMPWGRLRQAPDGSLWMPDYAVGLNPENGGFSPYASNYTLRSTDGGRTWDLMHYLDFRPSTFDHPRAFQHEGYSENDIGFAPDGSYIRVTRTNAVNPDVHGPLYLVRSTDKGVTWSEPIKLDDVCAWPRLCTLKCGVTLTSYGRPGFFVRATSDPSCLTWEDPIELVHVEDGEDPWAATCSYSDIMALDDHTAGLIYTDFKVKDENGVERKTVLFRTITVEE